MKVAICAHDYPHYTSGPNVWLLRIVKEFRKFNIESVILFTRGGIGSDYIYIQAVRNEGLPYYVYNGPRYTENKIRWILKIIQNQKPDIFVPNIDVPALYAARWIKEAGIPTIGVLRSDEKLYYSILEHFVWKSSPFRLDALVCVSKYLKEISESFNSNGTLIKNIPSGTPIPAQTAKRNDNCLRLIYAGRLTEKAKRISEVTSVLCRTVREVEGTEAVIYGSGEAKDSVLEIINREGHGLPVRYDGVVDSYEMQTKLLEGHVFVLLSEYEGLPTSLMEGMASGLVPVCLDIRSGIPELVENEKTGLLVNDRGDDFVRAIRRLRYEDGLWDTLSAGARKKAEDDYSIKASVQKWEELFQELLVNNNIEKRVLKIPRRFEIKNTHSDFQHADQIWPGYVQYLSRSVRLKISRLYHYIAGGTVN